ncbi:MAG: GNA1162 family protein [Pseudomonadota bacterium]
MKMTLCLLLAALTLLSGCATQTVTKKDYAEFRKSNPRSVLVVPVINRSVDVDAPDYFLSSITRPIAERGYYVFPVNLIKRVMEDDGLADANMVHGSDTPKLASLFGADSVMYITIERWDSRYAVLSTVTTVELSYSLKSGATGQELWKHKELLAYDPTAQQSQAGLAGLIAKALVAALEKAKPNFMPLARQANGLAVARVGQGLPAGPQDAAYQKDTQEF